MKPVVTGPEMLARLLFEKYAGSSSDIRAVVLLDTEGRMLGTEIILVPELHGQWCGPRLMAAVLGDACTLVPFSYKTSPHFTGDPRDVEMVMTMKKWLRQFGLRVPDHLMIFSDGYWRSYGAAGDAGCSRNLAEGNEA